ncbi:MAG: hypothetical protein NTV77_01795 [Candidatus Azambacteria bacterium]|nr:hypothetical protein [Candidatus Azambacteria bacterium]
MKNPKVKFVINVNEDIKNYILFNKYSTEGPKFLKMFLPKELRYILTDGLSEKKKEKIIEEYVKYNFSLHEKEITQNTGKIKKRWKAVEKNYFKLINKIFKNHPWHQGKYLGFASVFDMYPRNIKEKTFYFPALGKNLNFAIATVAHEMTHFIFFDYLKAKYGIEEKKEFKNKDPKYIWDISEVLNVVIESWRPYLNIFKIKGKPYGKVHAKMLPKMKKLWDKKEDLDFLLDSYLSRLKQ